MASTVAANMAMITVGSRNIPRITNTTIRNRTASTGLPRVFTAKFCTSVWEVQAHQHVGKHARAHNGHVHHRGGHGRIDQDAGDVAPLQSFADAEAVQQTVQDGQHAGLGGCNDAKADAAEDDQGHHEGTQGVPCGDQQIFERETGAGDVVLTHPVFQVHNTHLQNAQQDTGHQCTHKQATHRHFGIVRIQDHGDAGRMMGTAWRNRP